MNQEDKVIQFSCKKLLGLGDDFVMGMTSYDKAWKNKVMESATSGFEFVEAEWSQKALDEYFNGPYVCSPNKYNAGYRNGVNWQGTSCLIIDFDNGLPAQDVVSKLNEYGFDYYINFSLSSTTALQRFHVVLRLSRPINLVGELEMLKPYLEQDLFFIKGLKPDSSVTCDSSRAIIRGRTDQPSIFCGVGSSFDVDEHIDALKRKSIFKDVVDAKTSVAHRWGWDDFIEIENHGIMTFREAFDMIDSGGEDKLRAHCPVCERIGDRTGNGHNSFLAYNAGGSPFLSCSSCKSRERGNGRKGVYNLNEEGCVELFKKEYVFIGTQLYRMKDGCFEKSIKDALPLDLGSMRDTLYHRLSLDCIMQDNFKEVIEHRADTVARSITWKDKNTLVRVEPRGAIDLEDDGSCEKWLRGIFGEHWQYVRDWMIVYGWWDGIKPKLPIFVFAGVPNAGKTSFSEIVSALYPKSVDATVQRLDEKFNNWADKKLVVIDESLLVQENKLKAYATLKTIIGNTMIGLEEKMERRRQIENKLNVIMITNDNKVMHIPIGERATSDKSNKFFIYVAKKEIEPWMGPLIGNAKRMIVDYIFRVCAWRWEELRGEIEDMSHGEGVRFCLKTPITEDQRAQEEMGLTGADHDWEDFLLELQKSRTAVGVDLKKMNKSWLKQQWRWGSYKHALEMMLEKGIARKHITKWKNNTIWFGLTDEGMDFGSFVEEDAAPVTPVTPVNEF